MKQNSNAYMAGELPQELCNLAFLETLIMGENHFSGIIPPCIFNISTLIALRLSVNQFSGSLPLDEGLSLPNLEELYLRNNKFTGPIPSCITNATLLTRLELSNNAFRGLLPNFSKLRSLQALLLWNNNFSGMEFISSLTNCRDLVHLLVSDNPLNDVLPKSIGNLSTSLRTFWATNCSIKGVIPSEIGNLSSLQNLYLSVNHQMTGLIPTTIGELRQLQIMHLYTTRLHGFIPVDLCKLRNLGNLYLFDNLLTGPLPECFGEMKSLKYLYLSSNKLNSTIPSTLWNLKDIVHLDLSSNYFSGQLSSQVAQLQVVTELDLSSNQFSGDIPDLINGCQSLEILILSDNKFGGSIPQSLGKLRGLTYIDLSNNNLSGVIPLSLEELRFLEYFNVSYNHLEGRIPNGGCFVNFTAQSFIHNTALCGETRFQVLPCANRHGSSGSKGVARLTRYIVLLVIPFTSAMILVIIMIVLIRSRKHKRMPPQVDNLLGTTWRVISYSEIVRATNSFSEIELLGRGSVGSVFKGTLSNNMNIAVKVFNLQSDRANKSFANESKILSTIRHRNLVRIISSCTNMEFKALILEFMPNGSLEKWLYTNNYCLDLQQRLNIAMDVALALEYLHHGLTVPIVHCDIKPENVLLDGDMTARVADFGISKLLDEGEAKIYTKTLATIGYAAPGNVQMLMILNFQFLS